MKINLREFAFASGLVVVAFCSGCETNRAKADTVPASTNPPAVAVAVPVPVAPVAFPASAPSSSSAPGPVQPAGLPDGFGVPASAPAVPVAPAPPLAAGAVTATASVPGGPAAVAAVGTTAPSNSVDPGTNVSATVVRDATVPGQLNLTPALAQVAQLIQAGVNPDIVMAYVTNSTEFFNVGPREILYLHDLGAPTSIVTALIQKDSTPEAQAKRQALVAMQSMPPGAALNTPATNIYPPTGTVPVPNPGEPPPVVVTPQPNVTTVSVPVTNVVVVQPEPVTVTYFESELSPYGSWVYVNGYGRCWRPTVAVWNVGWRPYCDGGRWLWTDAGWYWYSDYSWGWAPFHYGRWFCPPGVGWVWYPDVHWGPAWVSWRHSPSYCGWAPLPPSAHWVHGHGFVHNSLSVGVSFEFGLGYSDYVFVSYDRFCDRRPMAHLVGHHRSREIYESTRVVNNYAFKNNGVVNHGAGVEPVNTITRGNVRRVALRENSPMATRDSIGRRESLDPEGRTLAITRPSASALAARVPLTAPPTRPSRAAVSGDSTPVSAVPPSSLVGGGSFAPGTDSGGSRFVPRTSPSTSGSTVTRPSETVRRTEMPATTKPLITSPPTGEPRNPGSGVVSVTPPTGAPTATPNNGSVIRPYTRPSTRQPSILTGGQNNPAVPSAPPTRTPTPPLSTPPANLVSRPPGPSSPPTSAPSVPSAPSTPSTPRSGPVTRPPGFTSRSVDTGSGSGSGSGVSAPRSAPVPRDNGRVSVPQNNSGGNVIVRPSNPAPSRPAYTPPSGGGGGGGGGGVSRPAPAPRVEVSRPAPAPSRNEGSGSRSSGGGRSGGAEGGGRGRNRD